MKPTNEQKLLLAKHFGSARFAYNYFLDQRKKFYIENKNSKVKKGLSYYDNCKELTTLKKKLTWLKEINAQTLQATLKNLDTAYSNFFHQRARFPKFKSRFSKQSFRVPQHVKIKDNKVFFPKFKEGIAFIKHREIEGEIKFATISKNPSGDYMVSITVEKEIEELPKTNKAVGIDLGIKTLATLSNGKTYKGIKYYRKFEKKIRQLQKAKDRKQKDGSNRNKARIKVAKCHKKISNKRKDTIHKATTDIVKKNDVIVIEDLNIKGMVKNHKLAKSINDSSFGMFRQFLEYKCKWYGKHLVKVDRFFPSSKTCNNCGYINHSLTLKDREWECPSCKSILDRDKNASLNILREGLKALTAGTAEIAFGDDVRPCLQGYCQ